MCQSEWWLWFLSCLPQVHHLCAEGLVFFYTFRRNYAFLLNNAVFLHTLWPWAAVPGPKQQKKESLFWKLRSKAPVNRSTGRQNSFSKCLLFLVSRFFVAASISFETKDFIFFWRVVTRKFFRNPVPSKKFPTWRLGLGHAAGLAGRLHPSLWGCATGLCGQPSSTSAKSWLGGRIMGGIFFLMRDLIFQTCKWLITVVSKSPK